MTDYLISDKNGLKRTSILKVINFLIYRDLKKFFYFLFFLFQFKYIKNSFYVRVDVSDD